MSLKRRRSRSSVNGGLVLAWAGALIALVLLVVAGLGLAKLRSERAGIDPQTLCPSKTPDQVMALLFDSSDPLTPLQQIKVRQLLDGLLINIPKGARLDVYMATAEAGQLAKPLFSRCNPAAQNSATGWSENPQRLLALRKREFLQPLEKALEAALQAQPRKTSPILETIAAASVQSFGGAGSSGFGTGKQYKMIIVSDFLQNSRVLTHYKSYPDVEGFSNREGWIQTLPKLKGVSILMVYISRANSMNLQNKEHASWWCDYFAKRGTAFCEIEKI